ncbi:MAG: hypothetical protein RI907_3375, partial [Pseudomonadota bacterium]
MTNDDREIRRFIHDRFVELFLSHSNRAQAALLATKVLAASIWFRRTGEGLAWAWLAISVLVIAWRWLGTRQFVMRGGRGQTSLRIATVLAINGVLMAVPLWAFPAMTEGERAMLAMVIVATGTASAVTTSGHLHVYLAFTLPMFLALAAAFFWEGMQLDRLGNWGVATMVVLYQAFLIGFGRQSNQLFEESCRYRYGEQEHNRTLKQALEQADESNRAKTRFLAAASHDLRQPIHSMTVLVAALKLRETDSGCQEIVHLLDTVNQAMSRQLDSLLDISKLDAGAVAPVLLPLRLDHLLEGLQMTWAPVARERRVLLHVDAELGLGTVSDEALLSRVLNNLVDNAMKFTPTGGEVSISLIRSAEAVSIKVRDSGVGIPAHEREKVFQEFYQLSNPERDRTKGLGLGLSIVRRLCTLLDISLTLDSTEGLGTTVTLTMPHAAALPVGGANPAAARRAPTGCVVLVIDDEQVVRMSMRLLLLQVGCEVLLAESREQAVAHAAQGRIDVVLSDFRLRDGDS